LRTIWIFAGVLVAAGVLVGAVDLLRPSDQRTHVGKFFEKVFTDLPSATLVLQRKASENLSVLGHSLLLGGVIALAVVIAYFWWVQPRSLRVLFERISTARATAIALGVLALLGFALNDSGVTIPGMMAAVTEAAVVVLLARVVFIEPRPEPVRAPADDHDPADAAPDIEPVPSP
jgi:hypothetical protein